MTNFGLSVCALFAEIPLALPSIFDQKSMPKSSKLLNLINLIALLSINNFLQKSGIRQNQSFYKLAIVCIAIIFQVVISPLLGTINKPYRKNIRYYT